MNERIEWTKECPICGENLTVSVYDEVVSQSVHVKIHCDNCDKYCFERSYPRVEVYKHCSKYGDDIVPSLLAHTLAEVEKNMAGQPDDKDKPEEQKTVPFYTALKACIEDGKKITRADWNGANMFVWFTPPRKVSISKWRNEGGLPPTKDEIARGCVQLQGHFDMYNAQGLRISGWLASQTDLYSDQWIILDD